MFHFTLVSALSGHLWVLLETNSNELLHHFNDTTSLQYLQLSLLNTTDCNEYSTSGSTLLSGVQEITQTILRNESSHIQSKLDSVVLVTNKCIKETVMIYSLIQRLIDVPSLVISVVPVNSYIPEVMQLVPSTLCILKAYISLFQTLNWNRLGLIYDYSLHFTNAYEEFQNMLQNQNIKAIFFPQSLGKTIEDLLQQLHDSGVKIFIMLTSKTTPLLCAAYKRGMTWPDYGWLLYGYSMPDIKLIPPCEGSHSYLERTVFPTYYTNPITEADMKENVLLLLQKTSVESVQHNTDFNTILSRIPIPGINTTLLSIQEDFPHVYFVQLINATPSTVATVYNNTVLQNSWLQEDKLPAGRLPVMVNTVYPAWLGVLEAIVCSILITLTLILYIYYRNEPEVKATSWSLSLLMFLGCYLITLYLIIFTIRSMYPPKVAFELHICPLLVWLSAVGTSYPLILAVLMVKLLRVYRIFYYYSHVGRLCSDTALAAYVLLLLSPIILSLIVMTSLKAYRWSEKTITHLDRVEVLYVCVGDLGPYYTVNASCIIALTVGVMVAAIKTRKLRHKHFRDAKKVNVFAFLVVLSGLSSLIMYKLFSDRSLYLPAYITIHVIHCSFIALCLGFLFTPKLTPILLRKYLSRTNKTYGNKFAKELRTPIFNRATRENN